MKFGKTFESLLTSEWQQQYMKYNVCNLNMIDKPQ